MHLLVKPCFLIYFLGEQSEVKGLTLYHVGNQLVLFYWFAAQLRGVGSVSYGDIHSFFIFRERLDRHHQVSNQAG